MEAKTNRIDVDTYFMMVAKVVSLRATCRHREQGAVLVRNNRIIATGYNGSPPGQPHCIDAGYCSKDAHSICRADGLHGESNAIASAASEGISTSGAIIYCIYSPCKSCCNLLKSAGIVEVKYLEEYSTDPSGPDYLAQLDIKVSKIEETEMLTWKYRQTSTNS